MKLSRRIFFSALLFAGPSRQKALEVSVLETFGIHGRIVAVLANHSNDPSRESFAKWLRSNPKTTVRVRTPAGSGATAYVFRVRMCFGRALIVLHESVEIREGEKLSIEWKDN
jgi:hypothetical protein